MPIFELPGEIHLQRNSSFTLSAYDAGVVGGVCVLNVRIRFRMDRHRRWWLAGPMVATLLLGLVACSSDPASEIGDRVLAKVGEKVITVSDFEREVDRRRHHLPVAPSSTAQKQALLNEMIELELVASRARQEGYEEDVDLAFQFKRMLAGKYKEDKISKSLSRISITAEELASYYETNIDLYTIPERVKAALITLQIPPEASVDKRAAIRDRALEARQKANDLSPSIRSFGALAKSFSDDPSTRFIGGGDRLAFEGLG